ncbi:IS3 family transposase, partial [Aeromonas veronii]|uniref:IS3 family transposase n=2 Tax=Aeromonas TaxID=642 RepID=UPI00214DAE35
HHRFKTRAEAKAAIQEYIEIFYNRQHRHSRLGNVSPAEFNKRYWRTAQAACSWTVRSCQDTPARPAPV